MRLDCKQLTSKAFALLLGILHAPCEAQQVATHPNAKSPNGDQANEQAEQLLRSGFPIASALVAQQGLMNAADPFAKSMRRQWMILQKVAQHRSIHNIYQQLAVHLKTSAEIEAIGSESILSELRYHLGNAYFDEQKYALAISEYKKLRIKDRLFMPAKFHQAIALVQLNQIEEAEKTLRSILMDPVAQASSLSPASKRALQARVHLALGRTNYERRQFKQSSVHLRQIEKGDPVFYEALFEQAWAYFMAGHPRHALGAIYSAESPFFEQVHNPELPLLKAMIYYWMCRYQDSRNALASFAETYKLQVQGLKRFLDRQRLDSKSAYQLFENLVAGVSSRSLGISTEILQHVAQRESMMIYREQYADVIAELSKVKASSRTSNSPLRSVAESHLQKQSQKIKNALGQQFISELKQTQEHYERLNEQAEFLYLELMMSEKDELLGKNLHAQAKLNQALAHRSAQGWSKDQVSWRSDDKHEFWWDELGFHIEEVPSLCR